MLRKLFKGLMITFGSLFCLLLLAFIAVSIKYSTTYAWRLLSMGKSDTGDINRFPMRSIPNGGSVSPLPEGTGAVPTEVTFSYQGQPRTENLQQLILRTQTSAFVVVQADAIILHTYHNSITSTLHTSFSMAKSFNSAMIGAAIADGSIGSVDDPVVKYVPEIAGRGLDGLTIRNLLRMDSGIRYIGADDRPFFLLPVTDDALTYYHPNLRSLAMSVQPSNTSIGAAFHYNNYHPLLEGLILERATGMYVTEYLSQKIWAPMGAEFQAFWSLDGIKDGFEKMESGINATAADYARFGLVYLHNGFYNGQQILPEDWIAASTAPDPTDTRPWETMQTYPSFGGYYGYHWWGMKNADGSYDFSCQGHLGQMIYVAPRKNVVIVRLGAEPDPDVLWPLVLQALVDRLP